MLLSQVIKHPVKPDTPSANELAKVVAERTAQERLKLHAKEKQDMMSANKRGAAAMNKERVRNDAERSTSSHSKAPSSRSLHHKAYYSHFRLSYGLGCLKTWKSGQCKIVLKGVQTAMRSLK